MHIQMGLAVCVDAMSALCASGLDRCGEWKNANGLGTKREREIERMYTLATHPPTPAPRRPGLSAPFALPSATRRPA